MGAAASRCSSSLLRSRMIVYCIEASDSPLLYPLRLVVALVISAALTVRAARLYLRCGLHSVRPYSSEVPQYLPKHPLHLLPAQL